MQSNALLDVAIGLALLYLLLSLFVTIINEWISSLFKLRARNLRRGLRQLIDDPDLLQLFESSATFQGLKEASGARRPAWLPPSVGPSYLPSSHFAMAMLEAIARREEKPPRELNTADLIEIIPRLPDTRIRDQLSCFLEDAEQGMAAFKTEVAEWFDDVMERASGVFRRWMQAISFAVGLLLTVMLNVDTVFVASSLWEDESLRTQLAESGQQFMADRSDLDVLPELKDIHGELRPFPIGWSPVRSDAVFDSAGSLLSTLFGWLLTAAAIGLGAPFWFGLLEKLTKIRGSGNAPAASRAERPKV